MLLIRPAIEPDSEAACDVVRRSIQDLCTADHQNDRATLEAWLANKTVTMFERWICNPANTCVVAAREGCICGFGFMKQTGEIGLLYVAPEARFLGASTLMLRCLEERATQLGIRAVSLKSSQTAKRFYEGRGYTQSSEPTAGFGITRAWPMEKQLPYESSAA